MTTKTTDVVGGPIIAMDLPYDFTAPVVVDLTESRFETTADWGRDETPTKKEENAVQLYEKVLADLAEKGAAPKTADLSEEDAMYEAFVRESDLKSYLPDREPDAASPADLSAQAGEQADTSGTADMSAEDERLYRQFVEESGASWLLGEAGTAAADMTEQGQADKQAESMREQAEADALHEDLRRQSHEDHFGGGSELSDEAMWGQYRDALGQP